jgi:FkbM family methyltransferase
MRKIYASNGWQYFDLFQPESKEIFIDAGSYNGNTSLQFIKWCRGDYEKIYAFEPDKLCRSRCIDTFSKNKVENIEFVEKGTFNKTGQMSFLQSGMSFSKITDSEEGKDSIAVTTIDEVLNGERASFIKMDVEGAELESLEGAKKTIEKYHPRLAISLYHKPEDVITLPLYILDISKDYKFFIRHYTASLNETILYAV